LVGAAILIGLVPLSKWVAHWIVQIRKKRVAVADERVEIVSAMLQEELVWCKWCAILIYLFLPVQHSKRSNPLLLKVHS
jgi:hypothetical protein